MDSQRRIAIERALEAHAASEPKRTHQVEYRGTQRTVEVVTIGPDIPLLNPNNSRLRAQLRNHPNGSIVTKDPFSQESQALLGSLLSSTEKFENLKTQLVDFGQSEPGIISRDGLLVNGNTRLTAIRQLGMTGFDVAVLPDDAVDEDFFNIEMSLQLRKLVHQDYTFTNELLLVDNYLQRSGSEEATIQAMQWKRDGKNRLRKFQGYLQLIEEIIGLNPSISYAFFDSRKELISNLYERYITLASESPKKAEEFKQTRIIGMLLGLNKDEVREIQEYFFEDEILSGAEETGLDELLHGYTTSSNEQDPLEELLGTAKGSAIDLKKLASDVALKVVNDDGQIDESLVESNFRQLYSSMRSSARQIREDRINSEMRSEPIEYLREVTKKIQELADQIPTLFRDENFDKGKFSHQSRKTKQAIEQLSQALSRASNDPIDEH